MELNTFYICINENREATVRVEAHDIDEAFDRLNSAYGKDVIELEKSMMRGADMEDITEQIRNNGWYHGRTVDIELPYDRELAEPERGTIPDKAAADYTAQTYGRYQKITDLLIGELRECGIRYDELEQLQTCIKANLWRRAVIF